MNQTFDKLSNNISFSFSDYVSDGSTESDGLSQLSIEPEYEEEEEEAVAEKEKSSVPSCMGSTTKSTQTDYVHDQSQPSSNGMQFGPHKKYTRMEECYAFPSISNLYDDQKVLCSVELLSELFGNMCKYHGCVHQVCVKKCYVGATLIFQWSCRAGHKGKFSTSKTVKGLYVNNVILAASILLSGNNFEKVEKMFNFANIHFVTRDMFFRYQRKLFFPVIEGWWQWMEETLIDQLSNESVILARDGQFDSPGKTAKYLSYFLVHSQSRQIVKVEIFDKRMTHGKSTTMETEALKSALKSTMEHLSVTELETCNRCILECHKGDK